MAGGEGSRLRPVTCDIPKPMAPIASLPAMCHIIRLLKGCGVDEAAVTTMYLADEVEKIGSEFEGVRLKYLREETPLGTAGSVKRASADFEEDFIVISGDCICDFDIAGAVEFHKSKKADCTILLAEKPYPLEYGVVMCENDGRVSRFIEKPAWSQVFSDCVNTGIYIINPRIMSLVPENKKYDFSMDLFPRLIGGKMYGRRVEGYWCDVGTPRDYYRCNLDALDGKLRLYDTVSASENPSEPAKEAPAEPDRTPRRRNGFCAVVPCASRARLMRALTEKLMFEAGADFSDGLTLPGVHFAPDERQNAVRVEAQDANSLQNWEKLARALEQDI